MLFNYVYVTHRLEKLQNWLEHLVKNVWCDPKPHFYLRLLEPELQKIVRETVKNAKRRDYLWKPIREIHNICRDQLSPQDRLALIKWFDDNNDIESLCIGRAGINPTTYTDISKINAKLAKELETFCTNLWCKVRKLKPVQARIGTLSGHYKEFRNINKTATCPFCGLVRLEGTFSSTQEDYDHYLPKGTYAFNAVTLKNLAPICDKCNKKFKLKQDPLHTKSKKTRRKAFYAFSTLNSGINLTIAITPIKGASLDHQNLTPANIKINITSPGREEELTGWKELFKIESRYKDVCCAGDTGGSYWLEQVLGEMRLHGKTPADALYNIQRAAAESKWADTNFLKIPFLDGCRDAGLIR